MWSWLFAMAGRRRFVLLQGKDGSWAPLDGLAFALLASLRSAAVSKGADEPEEAPKTALGRLGAKLRQLTEAAERRMKKNNLLMAAAEQAEDEDLGVDLVGDNAGGLRQGDAAARPPPPPPTRSGSGEASPPPAGTARSGRHHSGSVGSAGARAARTSVVQHVVSSTLHEHAGDDPLSFSVDALDESLPRQLAEVSVGRAEHAGRIWATTLSLRTLSGMNIGWLADEEVSARRPRTNPSDGWRTRNPSTPL